MPEWLPVMVSAGTALLLLYVGLVMRSFARSVDRLENTTERLSTSVSKIIERLARVETKLEQK